MCGIAGLQQNKKNLTSSEEVIKKFAQLLTHRGPDGSGHYLHDKTALVHTRLAIIDLQGGAQPLNLNSVNLVANGEIYNYKELSQALSPIQLKTHSDCELPLHLWLIQAKEFTKQLRGMYAIALYDEKNQLLVLARDPFGIKPLYYTETANGIAFASEPQALIKTGIIKPEINLKAREEFLQLQFTLGEKTIFEGIQRVLPGQTLFCQNGKIVESSRISALPEAKIKKMNEEQALKLIESALEESISIHLRSDVPYGVFLSGGIDSSIILSMMARLTTQPILSFTAGFDTTDAVDERKKAEKIAAAVGSQHESIEINETMVWEHLPEIVANMDDPCADYAIIPTWFLARHAARNLKVVLCGEGGDELFGGYGRYRHFMRHPLLGGKVMRSKGCFDRVKVLREQPRHWRDAFRVAELDAAAHYPTRLMQAQAIDCMDWLPHDLLLKLDRCLMAHGLEGRTPFLDPIVATAAFTLPDELKVRDGFGKWILRRWLQHNLPASEAFNPKQGFTVPIGTWIAHQARQLGHLVSQQLGILEIAKPEHVSALFQNIGKKKGAGVAAWTLLFYALWHQHHILGHAYTADVFDVLSQK